MPALKIPACHFAGGVECWLLRVERALKQALHSITRESLAAYVTTPRHQWILQWPGQTVLAGSQVHWTRQVTDTIQSGGSKGLAAYAAKCTQVRCKPCLATGLPSRLTQISGRCSDHHRLSTHSRCTASTPTVMLPCACTTARLSGPQQDRVPGARQPHVSGARHVRRPGRHRRPCAVRPRARVAAAGANRHAFGPVRTCLYSPVL